ncbi:MAG: alpha/beta hydrolase, partial [Actinomycetota bacterium]|nr:alpha/beta hydrolase [Actinomycetota bacterium]
LRAPLLVLHGEGDDVVPLSHARNLFEAAPEPKRIATFPGVGHADIVALAGEALAREIASWARGLAA